MKKLTSRKLILTISGISAICFLVSQGLEVQWAAGLISGLCGTYNIGQGIADAGAGKSQTSES